MQYRCSAPYNVSFPEESFYRYRLLPDTDVDRNRSMLNIVDLQYYSSKINRFKR